MDLQLLTQHRTAGPAPVPDETLAWKNLLGGDRKALAHLYARYFDKLYNYGIKISPQTTLIEDAIQDLFLELWSRRQSLNPEVKSIKYYLFISLRRKILLRLHQHKKNENVALTSFDLKLAHRSHYLTSQLNVELKEKLAQVIETLTPKQKEALFLIYFEELPYQQAADVMSLKVKTIYNLVHQAIARLKEKKDNFWSFS